MKIRREILRIRHHTLFTPRDFDISPYFTIIKPTPEQGFDPHTLTWEQSDEHRPHTLAAPFTTT